MSAIDSLVITHAACPDGFAAAWVARKYLQSQGRSFEIVFAVHNTEPPWEQIKDRNVYILDFAYKLPLMKRIEQEAKTLTVLDHHKSAEDDLRGFACAIFDMNRSGAGMAWDYFYPGQARPWTIDYVEDRDLWRWKLPDSQAVNAYISTLPYDYDRWDEVEKVEDFALVCGMGHVVLNKVKHYVSETKKNAIRIDFEGYNVPCVNAPQVNISELVGELAEGEPFAMGWFQRSDGKFQYSLRSQGDVDVSRIAKKHGGGGHVKAAGFDQEYPFHIADTDGEVPWRACVLMVTVLVLFWVALNVYPFA